jgi:hypothetical protein
MWWECGLIQIVTLPYWWPQQKWQGRVLFPLPSANTKSHFKNKWLGRIKCRNNMPCNGVLFLFLHR